ncbi:MAG: carbon storage regulator CsrA [Spirochaetales bacterium]|nr:carbon storage regulator CsrA [Spirochaetales bacterium]
MLILARRLNEQIVIGDDIRVSVVDIRGDQVKLGIEAPRSVKVYRQEVYDAIQAENREAAQSVTAIPSLDPYLKTDIPDLTKDTQAK